MTENHDLAPGAAELSSQQEWAQPPDSRVPPVPQPGGSAGPSSVPDDFVAGPGTGGQPAASGGYPPGSGVPAPAPALWRRGRVRVIAGIVAVLLAVLGFVLQHAASSAGGAARGSVTLPGTLLGVRQNTSPAARAVDRALARGLVAAAGQGHFLHEVVGVYGSLSGAGFFVEGDAGCGNCPPESAAAALRRLRMDNPDARLFPPGPNGGTLVCAPRPAQTAVFACWWYDDKTSGLAYYWSGSASGVADAAAKTNQIRAAIEH